MRIFKITTTNVDKKFTMKKEKTIKIKDLLASKGRRIEMEFLFELITTDN